MILLLMFMNSMSHGTQDMFPTYLTRQMHYAPKLVATITMLATLGNLCGALTGGRLSDRWGRRKVIMTAVALALILIPLWMWAPNIPTIIIGAFLMQFMVTGAWGVMPAHINELSPPQLRGFFPGFVYQMGVLCASSISYIEARLGEHLSYSRAMSMSMVVVLACLLLTIALGPEAKGVAFVDAKVPPPLTTSLFLSHPPSKTAHRESTPSSLEFRLSRRLFPCCPPRPPCGERRITACKTSLRKSFANELTGEKRLTSDVSANAFQAGEAFEVMMSRQKQKWAVQPAVFLCWLALRRYCFSALHAGAAARAHRPIARRPTCRLAAVERDRGAPSRGGSQLGGSQAPVKYSFVAVLPLENTSFSQVIGDTTDALLPEQPDQLPRE